MVPNRTPPPLSRRRNPGSLPTDAIGTPSPIRLWRCHSKHKEMSWPLSGSASSATRSTSASAGHPPRKRPTTARSRNGPAPPAPGPSSSSSTSPRSPVQRRPALLADLRPPSSSRSQATLSVAGHAPRDPTHHGVPAMQQLDAPVSSPTEDLDDDDRLIGRILSRREVLTLLG